MDLLIIIMQVILQLNTVLQVIIQPIAPPPTLGQPEQPTIQPCQIIVSGITIDLCNSEELEQQQSFQNTTANFPKFGGGGGGIGPSGYRTRAIWRRPQPSGGSAYPKLYKYASASLQERDLAMPRDKLRRLMKQLRPQEPQPVHLTQGMLDKYLDEHPLPDVRQSFRNIQRGIDQ